MSEPIVIPPEDEAKYTKIVRKHLELIPQLRRQMGMPPGSAWMPHLFYAWAVPGTQAYAGMDEFKVPTTTMIEIPVEDYADVAQLTGCSVLGAEGLGLKLYLKVPVV